MRRTSMLPRLALTLAALIAASSLAACGGGSTPATDTPSAAPPADAPSEAAAPSSAATEEAAAPSAGATDPCGLLTAEEVATVLPDAGAPTVVPGQQQGGASTAGCAWIGSNGLDRLALTVISAPAAVLTAAFDGQLAAGGQPIDGLGDRAAFASRVAGSGEVAVITGDTLLGLTLTATGAETQQPALTTLARAALTRR